jgi:hypothetical protein
LGGNAGYPLNSKHEYRPVYRSYPMSETPMHCRVGSQDYACCQTWPATDEFNEVAVIFGIDFRPGSCGSRLLAALVWLVSLWAKY